MRSGGGGEQRTGTKEKHTMKYNLCVIVCVYQIHQNISFCVLHSSCNSDMQTKDTPETRSNSIIYLGLTLCQPHE